jgi:hypothetical protein
LRHGLSGDAFKVIGHRIVMRRRLDRDLGEGVQILKEGGRIGLKAKLPPSLQAQEKDQDGGPQQRLLGIIGLAGEAGVWKRSQQRGKNPAENAGRSWPGSDLRLESLSASGGGPACGHVAVDDRQAAVGDLPNQKFEPLVLPDPLLHLRDQILGDMNGTRLGVYLIGKDIGLMGLAFGALTAGISTPTTDSA